MRATIRDLIVANGPLTVLVPTERWFQAGSVVDVPPLPFAVLRWISPVSGDARGTFANQLRVDVHGKRGSYKPVDDILGGPHRVGGVYPILAGIMGHTGADGYIAQADYLGESGDDVDINFKSNFRYSSWQIIGRSL